MFSKAIAECNFSLEWIKTKQNMLTMLKMVKESHEEFVQDTPITSRKPLEKTKDELNLKGN